jgi:hypothetical protein
MISRNVRVAAFALAGAYILAWGAYAALEAQWLFRVAGMPPLYHPAIFACLGMVVGIYGFLYWEVARVPERGFAIAAVGLLGKVLGPVGLARLIATGAWPPATLVLCLTNDFVWWIPFALYLHDAWPFYRADRVAERAV